MNSLGVKFVYKEVIEGIVNNYDKDIPFQESDLDNFISVDGDKWLALWNIDGNAWLEEFNTLEEALKYLL